MSTKLKMTSKFTRLLTNLPFNPSLIGKVSFYSRRLRQEASIRRLGFVFIALAMLVQSYAVISPPEPTLASSGNDIISGGFSSKNEAVGHCLSNTDFFAAILGHFGISCDNLANSQTVNLRSNDYNGQLFSLGRTPYGKEGETAVPTYLAGTLWLRYLWSWDTYGSSTYTALQGTSDSGTTFFVLYNCGNLVFIGLPSSPAPAPTPPPTTPTPSPVIPPPVVIPPDVPVAKCPYDPVLSASDPSCKPCQQSQNQQDGLSCLQYSKTASNNTRNITNANGSIANAGDTITYTLTVRNTGKADVSGVVVQENISDILDYADVVDLKGGTKDSRNIVSWPAQRVKALSEINRQLVVRVKNPVPQTTVSSSDPGHFDLTMTNVYGNTVNIKLPSTIIKTTETINRTMPKTGPGSSLIAGFTLTAVVAYFFMRARLMSKELELVRIEYNASGSI